MRVPKTLSVFSVSRFAELDGRGRLFEQVYRAIRSAILSGRILAGDRLPASRELAVDFGVSRSVILNAFDCLMADDFIVSHVGKGTFVNSDIDTRQVHAEEIRAASFDEQFESAVSLTDFGFAASTACAFDAYIQQTSNLSARFNFEYGSPWVSNSLRRNWRRASSASQSELNGFYGHPAGNERLRRTIAELVNQSRGVNCDHEQIVIFSGAQQAFDILARCFAGTGSIVACENPGYFGARRAFLANGANVVGVGVDENGICVDELESAHLRNVALVYTTPSHQMPVGCVTSVARRQALLAWAANRDTYIIEDDYDGEFRFGARQIPSLKSMDHSDRVFYVGTFSKTVFPTLRLAFVVAPRHLREMLVSAKMLTDAGTAEGPQMALARFMDDGDFARNLSASKRLYAQRRVALVNAIVNFLPDGRFQDTGVGLHLYVSFGPNEGFDICAVLADARHSGVALNDPRRYFSRPAECNGLILGYTQILKADVDEGVKILARCIQQNRSAHK